jgi:hypothetical protein
MLAATAIVDKNNNCPGCVSAAAVLTTNYTAEQALRTTVSHSWHG